MKLLCPAGVFFNGADRTKRLRPFLSLSLFLFFFLFFFLFLRCLRTTPGLASAFFSGWLALFVCLFVLLEFWLFFRFFLVFFLVVDRSNCSRPKRSSVGRLRRQSPCVFRFVGRRRRRRRRRRVITRRRNATEPPKQKKEPTENGRSAPASKNKKEKKEKKRKNQHTHTNRQESDIKKTRYKPNGARVVVVVVVVNEQRSMRNAGANQVRIRFHSQSMTAHERPRRPIRRRCVDGIRSTGDSGRKPHGPRGRSSLMAKHGRSRRAMTKMKTNICYS